jgi:hypothetical protein
MFGTFEFQRVASADQLADVMTKPLDSTLFNKCIRGFGMDDTPETQSYSQSPSYGGANAHDIQGAAAQTIVEQPLERKRKTSAQPSIKAKPTSAMVNHVDVRVGSVASPDTLTRPTQLSIRLTQCSYPVTHGRATGVNLLKGLNRLKTSDFLNHLFSQQNHLVYRGFLPLGGHTTPTLRSPRMSLVLENWTPV